MTTKILIADDHAVIRTGIIYLLKHRLSVDADIVEAKNGQEIAELVKAYRFDMMTMDLNMPETDAQSTIRYVLTRQPWINILVLSVNREELFGPLFQKLGVKAFVGKHSGEAELMEALRAVLKGNSYYRADLKELYQKKRGQDNPYAGVTDREMEVLTHLVKGVSIAQIARIMNIGISTASTHKASLFSKLNVDNIVELKELAQLFPI